jgi:clan AA aspartic protease (TIGR02281 family)
MVAPRIELGELRCRASRSSSTRSPARRRARRHRPVGPVANALEISWDRGVVTLGAQPWPDGTDVSSVPLEPFADGVETVTVRVNGRLLKMMLDTGAVVSAIPESAAGELGLEAEELPEHTFGGASGTFRADRVYTADIELGTAKLEGQRFMTSVSRNLAVLGRDILGQFNVAIVPGHRLFLRPRGDLRLTAEARVRRWPWMPACRSPGCVHARIRPIEGRRPPRGRHRGGLPGPIGSSSDAPIVRRERR